MSRKECVIKINNYCGQLELLAEFLSQYPKNQVPTINKVSMVEGRTYITVMLSSLEHAELKNFLQNHQT